jgi:hypothetical protein
MIRYVVAVFTLCAFAIATWAQDSPPGVAPQDQKQFKPSKHSGAPVVGEFQAQQESSQDYVRRQIRDRRYSDSSVLPEPISDPGAGVPETTNLTFIDYVALGKSSDPHGIPVSVSSAIVIGTVLSGNCFITSDHKFVYTDYQVRVDQILKPDATANLTVGGRLTSSRPGGSIHFPSGHLTHFLNPGHGLPTIGSQYVLFLWRAIPDLPEYEIIIDSGYELKGGRAYALDDANSEHDDVDAQMLLREIQKTLTASQNGGARP